MLTLTRAATCTVTDSGTGCKCQQQGRATEVHCKHGHVRKLYTCDMHVMQGGVCADCITGPAPHECTVHVITRR